MKVLLGKEESKGQNKSKPNDLGFNKNTTNLPLDSEAI